MERSTTMIVLAALFVSAACNDQYATSKQFICNWNDIDSLKCTGVNEDGVILLLTTREQKSALSLTQRQKQCSCSDANWSGINPNDLISPIPANKPELTQKLPADLPRLYDGDIDKLAPDFGSLANIIDTPFTPPNTPGINNKPVEPRYWWSGQRPPEEPTPLDETNRWSRAEWRKYYDDEKEWAEEESKRSKQRMDSLRPSFSLTGGDTQVEFAALEAYTAYLDNLQVKLKLIQSAEITEAEDGIVVKNGIASLALGSKVGTTDFSLEVELGENWEGMEFYGSGVVGIDLSKHRYDYNKLRIEIRASQNRWAVFNTDGNQLDSGKLWPAGYYAPLIKWGPLGVTLHDAKLKRASFKTLQ